MKKNAVMMFVYMEQTKFYLWDKLSSLQTLVPLNQIFEASKEETLALAGISP